MNQKVVGVTGALASGKTEVADALKIIGFEPLSLSQILRDEADRRGISRETREEKINFGNKLRAEKGLGVLAELALGYLDSSKNYVIESIRHPAEIKTLREKISNFHVIGVIAPQETRIQRALKRARDSDPKLYDKLKETDDKDIAIGIPECVANSDYVILNNKGLEELFEQIPIALAKVGCKRLPWANYFMQIADTIALRATCDRGRSGAVIVKDNRILTTGYVGSPPKLPHCDDVGHQFKEVTDKTGKVSKHCVRTTHAEQNAIAHAASYGVSINGATIYCKMTPCLDCAKSIIPAGIKKVVCKRKYHKGADSERMFKEVGIELVYFADKIEKYKKQ